MPYCFKCGNQVADDAKFCFACGAKLEVPATPAAEEPAYIPPEEAPVSQEPVYQEPVQQEPVYQAPVYQEPAYQEPVYQEPVYQAPQPEVTVPPADAIPEQSAKTKLFRKKPISLGRRLLVILLCVLTFIFGTAALAAYCIQDVISVEVITTLMDEIDLTEVNANDLITNAKKGDSLTQWLHSEMKKQVPKLTNLSEDDVQTYLEKFIYPFVKEEAAEFVEVLLSGKGEAAITQEEIRELLQSSTDYLQEEHGVILTDKDIDKLVNWIVDSELEEKANTDYLEDEFSDALELVRFLDGSIVFIIFAVLTLILLVLMIVTNRGLIRNLNSLGIVSVSVGGVFGLAALADLVMPKLVLELCAENELVANLVGSVLERVYLPLAILAGVGIVLLAVSNLLQAIKVKAK